MNLSRVCRGFAALRPVTQMLSGRPRRRRMIPVFPVFPVFSMILQIFLKIQVSKKKFIKNRKNRKTGNIGKRKSRIPERIAPAARATYDANGANVLAGRMRRSRTTPSRFNFISLFQENKNL